MSEENTVLICIFVFLSIVFVSIAAVAIFVPSNVQKNPTIQTCKICTGQVRGICTYGES